MSLYVWVADWLKRSCTVPQASSFKPQATPLIVRDAHSPTAQQ